MPTLTESMVDLSSNSVIKTLKPTNRCRFRRSGWAVCLKGRRSDVACGDGEQRFDGDAASGSRTLELYMGPVFKRRQVPRQQIQLTVETRQFSKGCNDGVDIRTSSKGAMEG